MKSSRLIAIIAALLPLVSSASDWKLVWSDEFDRPGLPDPEKWGYETGFVRNEEAQLYLANRKENTRVEGGQLIIEARKEKFTNPSYDAASFRNNKQTCEYTSGSLTTKDKHSWTYGRFEIRANLPTGRGTWPAIFTFGINKPLVRWPDCGEIDILEYVGFEPGLVHANVHTGKFNHTKKTGRGSMIKIDDAETAFHVYAMEWTPERMDFFVDDQKYFTCENDKGGDASWPFDKPQYLIINLAIGGAWGGTQGIDDAALPTRFEIDYVRIYQKAKTDS